MSVEPTSKETEEAREIEQLQLRVLEYRGKVGLKYKYLCVNMESNERLILQTEEAGIGFEMNKDYLVPVLRSKKKDQKFRNLADNYLDLISEFEIPESNLLDGATEWKPSENIPVVTVDDSPSEIESEGSSVVEFKGDIIKSPASLLSFLPPIKEAKEYFNYIQEFKKSILDKSDIQKIGDKSHICRSGWEKFVNVFRLEHWIVSTKKEITNQHLQTFKWDKTVQPWIKIPDRDEWLDGIQYTVIVAMKSLTGSMTQGVGLVQQYEGGRADRKEHDIIAHAETRAFNRACSKIIGLGEVSAEEVN